MVWSGVKFKIGFGITGGGFMLHKEIKYRNNVHPLEHNLDFLRGMNISIVNDRLQLYSSSKEKGIIKNFLRKNMIGEGDAFAVIHPFSRNISKNWLDKRFAKLITKLREDYELRIIVVGSGKDKKQIDKIIQLSGVDAINAAESVSLGALLELFERAGIFIGVDSAPSHIAALCHKPSVILYSGTNSPDEWAMVSKNAVIIQKDISCKGCERTDCRDNICMDLISVDDVLEAVDKVFKK
jgi:ADP-heptose:LPS heptosyltransferase